MAASRVWVTCMRYHEDGRRRFWGDIFDTPNGDINVVQLAPGIVIAWHRHLRQDDQIMAIYGAAYVQAIDPIGERHVWNLNAPKDQPISIPRGWWHGYATTEGATLVQFNGPGKWDGTDEERMSMDKMPWIPTP